MSVIDSRKNIDLSASEKELLEILKQPNNVSVGNEISSLFREQFGQDVKVSSPSGVILNSLESFKDIKCMMREQCIQDVYKELQKKHDDELQSLKLEYERKLEHWNDAYHLEVKKYLIIEQQFIKSIKDKEQCEGVIQSLQESVRQLTAAQPCIALSQNITLEYLKLQQVLIDKDKEIHELKK